MMTGIAARLKGSAKQAVSVLQGRTGIFAVLAKEHGQVSALMRQAVKAASAGKRNELLRRIRVELMSHDQAEEMTLYQSLSRIPSMKDIIVQSQLEHEELEQLLSIALSSAAEGPDAHRHLAMLQEAVERHIEREETRVFTLAEKHLSAERVVYLEQSFKHLKAEEKRRLSHDGAPFVAAASASRPEF